MNAELRLHYKNSQLNMISATALFIGKLILMLLIIGGMVVILMGIGHLFHVDDLNSAEDDLRLKDDLEKKETVVSDKSVFYNFLVRSEKERKEER